VLRDKLIEEKQRMLLNSFDLLLPGLKLIPDYAWAGTFGVTKDALPYIGRNKKYPNCFFVLGFGGNGITFSLMGMDMLSDSLAGRDNKFLNYYSFRR
jgi:glycine/D-amino acid oxidase-like deaminating enzyme